MDLLNRLETIEAKLRALQSNRLSLRSENENLRERIGVLEGLLQNEREQINNLKEQNKITKLAGGPSQEQDVHLLKEELDLLIEEIDQCIKLVKR